MAIAIFDLSIPALTRGLTSISALLDKGMAYATAMKFDSLVLAQSRLFPDMFPLVRQVQIACDTAKGGAARLASIEVPKHEDDEATLEDLQRRIAKTLDFLQSIQPVQMEGPVDRPIEIKFPNGAWKFTATSYVTDFMLPNFYFHESMVYALLRNNGVVIGKLDYLGTIQ